MIPALVMGMVAGCGLWLMARGWWPARRPLGAAVAALGRTGGAAPGDQPTESVWRRGVRSVAVAVEGDRVARRPSLAADLALIGRTAEEQAVDKLQTALFGAGLPVVLWLISTVGHRCRPVWSGWRRSRSGSADGSWPTHRPRHERRGGAQFRVVLATYLRLVTILLAGGAGVEALQDAAGGTGWGFSLLRRAVNDARLSGRSPWSVMLAVAERTGLDDLTELAGSIALAGGSGAQVRRSLEASAGALGAGTVRRRCPGRVADGRMNAPVAFLVIGRPLVIFPGVYSVVNL